jgi:Fe-S-cluster containining protein
MNRCTGACCKEFYLPRGPAQFAAEALGFFLLAEFGNPRDRQPNADHAEELSKIAQLAVPTREIGKGDTMPSGKAYAHEDRVQLYTCRWFDGTNCTVYETRPSMCRRYPYGSKCEHDTCSWDAARNGDVDNEGNLRPEGWRDEKQALTVEAERVHLPVVS